MYGQQDEKLTQAVFLLVIQRQSLELDRAGVPGANHPKMAHKKAF